MPGRSFNRNAYRYGSVNGQENDDEISTDDDSDYYGDEDAYNKLIQDI